jgi:hypothetical protein
MTLEARHSVTSVHIAPPPTLTISSHLQSIGSEKQRLEKFSHTRTFSKFHAGAAAATVIQRVWRSHISRLIQSDLLHLQRLVALESSVVAVQRCWRGHQGRLEAYGRISERNALCAGGARFNLTPIRRFEARQENRGIECKRERGAELV